MIKKIFYAVAILTIIYFTLCLFGPKKVQVERSITVNALNEDVKKQLADLKFFQETWSPWLDKDPYMKTTFEGEAGQPGYKYSWVGNKEVGSGSMELIAINGDTILQKVIFTAPRAGGGDVYFITKPQDHATNVRWGMKFDVGFMSRAFMLFMNMDKMIGTDYENGLAKFKTVMEAIPPAKTYHGYEIKEVIWPEKIYFGKKATLAFDKLNGFFAESFPKIFNAAINANLQHTGPPSGIFYTYDEQNKISECAAVISVPNEQQLKGWEKFDVPAADVALYIAYYGPYTKMANAHQAINDYMQEKGLTNSVVIEEYISGPMTEKDSTKWLTNIFYVIKGNGGVQINVQ